MTRTCCGTGFTEPHIPGCIFEPRPDEPIDYLGPFEIVPPMMVTAERDAAELLAAQPKSALVESGGLVATEVDTLRAELHHLRGLQRDDRDNARAAITERDGLRTQVADLRAQWNNFFPELRAAEEKNAWYAGELELLVRDNDRLTELEVELRDENDELRCRVQELEGEQ